MTSAKGKIYVGSSEDPKAAIGTERSIRRKGLTPAVSRIAAIRPNELDLIDRPGP
jgi:hypothetical protein